MNSTLIYGPPGIGKSTIGAILAESESRKHIDTDEEFVKQYGNIGEFINKHGLDAFRIREGKILEKYLWTGNVVSLGGGTLLLPENQKLADSTENIITLMTDIETLVTRTLTDNINSRPLTPSEEEVRKLYSERYSHYINQRLVINISPCELPERIAYNIERVQRGTRLLEPIY